MPSDLADHWALDPAITFLNHGSFGATPVAVMEEQARLRAVLETNPPSFFVRELERLWDDALAALAAELGAGPADLAFVANATSGLNAVLRSLELRPGDELLTTNHAYNAANNALDFVANRAGARVVTAPVPFPPASDDEVVAVVLAATTPATRLAVLDHVTSPTALVFPIRRLVAELTRRGIDTLVDGAHAPGMVAVDVESIGAAYYTGNCHKWLCAPKGAGFLHVRRDRQAGIVPTVISHGANSPRTDKPPFRLLFDWTGTHDPTPALSVPAALRLVAGLVDGGWPEVRRRNRALALEAAGLLHQALGAPAAPPGMIGSMAAVKLPPGDGTERRSATHALDPLQETLWLGHRIEVPVIQWPGAPHRLLRVSAHLHNSRDDYERLVVALAALG